MNSGGSSRPSGSGWAPISLLGSRQTMNCWGKRKHIPRPLRLIMSYIT